MPNIKSQTGGFGTTSGGTGPLTGAATLKTQSPLLINGGTSAPLIVNPTLTIETATLLAGIPTLAGINVFTGANWFTGPVNIVNGAPSLLGDLQVSGNLITYGAAQFGTGGGTRTATDGGLQVSGGERVYGTLRIGDALSPTLESAATLFTSALTGQNVFGIVSATNGPDASTIVAARTRGSALMPSGLQLGDSLGAYNFAGYNMNGAGIAAIVAAVSCTAKEAWAANTQGAYLSLLTSASGTASTIEQLRIDNNSIWFSPIYAGGVLAGARYLTSGDLSALPNFARRDAQNYFSGNTNVFSAQIIASGGLFATAPLYQGAVQTGSNRYVTSGELGAAVAATNIAYTTVSGGEPGAIPFFDAKRTLATDDPTFHWNDAGTRLYLGSNADPFNFASSANDIGVNLVPSGNALFAGQINFFKAGQFGSQSALTFHRSDGSVPAPTATASGYPMGYIQWAGYTTGYAVTAGIHADAAETSFGISRQGTKLTAFATRRGASSPTDLLYLGGDVDVQVPPGVKLLADRAVFANDVQFSGTTGLSFNPLYQGAAVAAQRYVTSGELGNTALPANVALRDTANSFTGSQNTFGPNTILLVSGEQRWAGGSNGSYLAIRSQERLFTLSGTATVMVTGMITGIGLAVATYNVTAISGGFPGFAGINIGISGLPGAWDNLYANNVAGTLGASTNFTGYNLGNVPIYATSQGVQVTASGGGKFAGGQMRMTAYYMEVQAPGS